MKNYISRVKINKIGVAVFVLMVGIVCIIISINDTYELAKEYSSISIFLLGYTFAWNGIVILVQWSYERNQLSFQNKEKG